MSKHLPALSRREFLVRTLVGSAALVLAPELLAASQRRDPNVWALLSDIHLSADASMVQRGINMTDHFTQATREVLALRKRPAGVIITGDCAFNSGQSVDYEHLARLLQPLRQGQVPVYIAMGNHDNRERFRAVLEAGGAPPRPLADRQVALLPTPRVNWIILDSLEKTLSTPGLLGPEQLDWLARTLDDHPKKPTLILAHHNVGTTAKRSDLKDSEAFLNIIRPRKQVKAYIYGHTHSWHVEQDPSGIHLINLPALGYFFRPEDPSGWVLATLKRRGMRLELRSMDPAHRAHGQVVELKWRAA